MVKTAEEKEAKRLAKEAKDLAKAEAKAAKLAKPVSFADVSKDMVNIVKAERAYRAVFGGAKGGSNELVLVQKLSGDFRDKAELCVEVYKGLGGLLNAQKAQVNRANEKKDKARKAVK